MSLVGIPRDERARIEREKLEEGVVLVSPSKAVASRASAGDLARFDFEVGGGGEYEQGWGSEENEDGERGGMMCRDTRGCSKHKKGRTATVDKLNAKDS